MTINSGLVHLGSFIREYLCHFRLKFFWIYIHTYIYIYTSSLRGSLSRPLRSPNRRCRLILCSTEGLFGGPGRQGGTCGGPPGAPRGSGGLKICSSSSAWSTLGGLFYKLFWLDDFYCGRKWQLHPTGTGSWGKISKCHISVMRQNKSKFFCACMLTLYIVTINPGLVQLGPLIREKFSILGPTLTNFPARLSAN